MKSRKNYYAVAVGRKIGKFKDWDTRKKLTDRYSDAKFEGFNIKEDCINFLKKTV